jgi:pyruvate kinase
VSQRFERRVKIVTTLGPATSGRDQLRDLILAGADMVRVNAAHGSDEDRKILIDDVRAASAELGLRVPILFDLRGLKIRTTSIENADAHDTVSVARGSKVTVVEGNVPTREGVIGIELPGLMGYLQPGSRLLISDGLIELFVESIDETSAICSVGRGGPLHSRQGVTLPGAPIDGGSMTEVDIRDTRFAVEQGVDYLGLSFIKTSLRREASCSTSRRVPHRTSSPRSSDLPHSKIWLNSRALPTQSWSPAETSACSFLPSRCRARRRQLSRPPTSSGCR